MEPTTRPEVLWLIAAALAPVVVARRLVEHRTVTVQTLLGAVAAYLQIAVAYAFAFQALDAVGARPFFGVQVPTTSYMYASLTAISTLGYGDLVPVTELGRLVAVSEAIVGQVYLVTFVAMLASRYASKPVVPRTPSTAWEQGRTTAPPEQTSGHSSRSVLAEAPPRSAGPAHQPRHPPPRHRLLTRIRCKDAALA